jgi:hypothetical protein
VQADNEAGTMSRTKLAAGLRSVAGLAITPPSMSFWRVSAGDVAA